MLDYKKLQEQVEEKLSKYSKNDLERWLRFDQQRLAKDSIELQVSLEIKVSSIRSVQLSDSREAVGTHLYHLDHAKAA